MSFTPSPEQQAIFDAALKGSGNIMVNALAGCGKTTTLVELARRLPKAGKNRQFCAFNKSIVDELEERLRGTGMIAKTFHSMGYGALIKHFGGKQPKVDGGKYKAIVKAWLALPEETKWEPATETARDLALEVRELVTETVKPLPPEERGDRAAELQKEFLNLATGLLNFLRLKLVEWDNADALRDLVDHYNLEETLPFGFVDLAVKAVPYLMSVAEARIKEAQEIDFTDQIYWVVRWNLTIKQNDWVFVDEAQDLSPMQRAMVAKALAPTGRIVLVADKNQAIYEFAGADSDSFDLSVKQFNAQVLPLTMTRRCAQVVTHHAARLVPAFQCPPDKPRGQFVWLMRERVVGVLEKSDMVLCRMKAPLISLCLNLIAANKPATILGTEIGKALIAILEKLTTRKDYEGFDKIDETLDAYEAELVEHYTSRDEPQLAEAIEDQCSAIRTLIDRAAATSLAELSAFIERLFSGDSNKDVILLTTVHKAKGLEAERVFILAPDRLPLNYPNMRPESAQQEMNLLYVAVTRAKQTLVIVTTEKYRKDRVMPSYGQTDFEEHSWPANEFEERAPGAHVWNDATETYERVSVDTAINLIAGGDSPAGETTTIDELVQMIKDSGVEGWDLELLPGYEDNGPSQWVLAYDDPEFADDIVLGSDLTIAKKRLEAELKTLAVKLPMPPAPVTPPVVIAPVPEKVDKLRAVVATLTDAELEDMIRYLSLFRDERRKASA